jgi:hypothetical protein
LCILPEKLLLERLRLLSVLGSAKSRRKECRMTQLGKTLPGYHDSTFLTIAMTMIKIVVEISETRTFLEALDSIVRLPQVITRP